MSIKIKVEREVSIASAFTHLVAAWDVSPYPWYRKVHYTERGIKAIENSREPHKTDVLAIVTIDSPKDDGETIMVNVTGAWLKRALELCLALPSCTRIPEEAHKIISEDSRSDQNTADAVFQVGAFGRIVFG